MNLMQKKASVGVLLLLLGGIFPLAYLDGQKISLFPVWNNLVIDNGLWSWRDISFFAFSSALIILSAVYFIFRKNYVFLFISGILSLFISFIVFFAIFFIKENLIISISSGIKISTGWIFLCAGSVLMILSGNKTVSEKMKS